jgi:RNA polymerase sigma-70 factor (ECF subfamily)
VDPISYLFGIARHVLADFLTSRRHTVFSLTDIGDEELVKRASQIVARDPADIALLQLFLAELLAKLPATQCKVLLAHELDGYSYREVARRLQISNQTVEKYLFLSKSYLRSLGR